MALGCKILVFMESPPKLAVALLEGSGPLGRTLCLGRCSFSYVLVNFVYFVFTNFCSDEKNGGWFSTNITDSVLTVF